MGILGIVLLVAATSVLATLFGGRPEEIKTEAATTNMLAPENPDIQANWVYVAPGPSHYAAIDECTGSGSCTPNAADYIQTGGLTFAVDEFSMQTQDLGGLAVSQVNVYLYCGSSPAGTSDVAVQIYDGSDWLALQSKCDNDNDQWNTATWTGLSWNQTNLNALKVKLTARGSEGAVWVRTLYAKATYTDPPAAPTILAATALSTSSIRWNFTDNSTNEDTWLVDISSASCATTNKAGTGYTASCDEGSLAVNTQYTRHVHAYNAAGESTASGNASRYTWPNPPTNQAASGDWDSVQGYHVDVNWAAGTGGANHYHVYRGGQLKYDGASITYAETGLVANTLYSYDIYAVNGDNVANPTPVSASDTTPLTAPTGLTHTNNAVSTITWDWADVTGATSYKVFAGTHSDSETTQVTGCVNPTSSTCTATGLSTNTQYTVHVHAVNANGTGANSSTSSAYTSIEAATGITFGTIATSSIALSASGSFSNLTAGSSGLLFTQTTGNPGGGGDACFSWTQTNSCTDTGLSPNTQYGYKVQSKNGNGDTTTETGISYKYTWPNSPTSQAASGDWDSTQNYHVDVNWAAGTGGANHYHVRSNSDNYASLKYNGSGTSWTETGLSANTPYTYRIYAVNADDAENTSYVSAFDTTPLTAPTGLTHTANTVSTITWDWADVTGATSYKVFAGTHSDSETTQVTDCADVTSSTCTATGLSTNTQYTVHVHAVNTNGTGANSSTSSAYTSIEAAADIHFNNISTTSLTPHTDSTFTNLAGGSSGTSGIQYCNVNKGTCEDWKKDTDQWLTDGLNVDSQYTITIRSQNGDSDPTDAASTDKYTYANVPGDPTVLVPADVGDTDTLNMIVVKNGNPEGGGIANDTEYAVYNEDLTCWVDPTDGSCDPTEPTENWYTYQNNLTNWGGSSGEFQDSLLTDTQYTYYVRARNGDETPTGDSGSIDRYTYAEQPGYVVPTPEADSISSIDLKLDKKSNPTGDTGDPDPPGIQNDTEYAIYIPTAGVEKWLGTDGVADEPAEVWATYSEWGGAGGLTNTGLSTNTQYTYQITARNGETPPNEEETNSTSADKYTRIEAPTGIIFPTMGIGENSLELQADTSLSNLGADLSRVFFSCVAGACHDSVDLHINSYTDIGLLANNQYCYKVQAFNGNNQASTVSSVPGDPGACKYTLGPSPGNSLVTVNPERLPIDDASTVTVYLRDAYNNALPGYTITITSSNGTDDIDYYNQVTDSSGKSIAYITSAQAHTSTLSFKADAIDLPHQPTITWYELDAPEGPVARIAGPDKAVVGTDVHFSGRGSTGTISEYNWAISDVYYNKVATVFTDTVKGENAVTYLIKDQDVISEPGKNVTEPANLNTIAAETSGVQKSESKIKSAGELEREAQEIASRQRPVIIKAYDVIIKAYDQVKSFVGDTVNQVSLWFSNFFQKQITPRNIKSSFISKVFAIDTLSGVEIDYNFPETGYYDVSLTAVSNDPTFNDSRAVHQILIVPPAPVITNIERDNDNIVISGTSWPNVNIDLYFSPGFASGSIGKTRASAAGFWQFSHPADEFSVGEYVVYGIAIDDHQIASKPSNEVVFKIDIHGNVIVVTPLPEQGLLSSKTIGWLKMISLVLSILAIASSLTSLLLGINLFNILPYLYYILTMLMEKLGIAKKREPWGIVYNSISKAPVELAIVRIFDVNKNKLLETRVTGKDGKFGFLVKPGTYKITITKYGFRFASQIVKPGKKNDDIYSNLYHGTAFAITPEKRLVNYNVPVDPLAKEKVKKPSLWRKIGAGILVSRYYVKKFIIPLIIFAIIVSIFTYFVTGESINILISAIMTILLAWEIWDRLQVRKWGIVYDSQTKKPISGAQVKIYEQEYHRLKDTRLTDKDGRFGFIVPDGKYSLEVEKEAYRFPSTRVRLKNDGKYHFVYHGEVIAKRRQDNVISVNIALDPKE